MYVIKAKDHAGRSASFACGTAVQAIDKAQELAGRGFVNILIVDPKGAEFSAAALERSLDRD